MSNTPGDFWENITVCLLLALAGMVSGSCLGRTLKQMDNNNICAAYCHPAEYTVAPLCICKEAP